MLFPIAFSNVVSSITHTHALPEDASELGFSRLQVAVYDNILFGNHGQLRQIRCVFLIEISNKPQANQSSQNNYCDYDFLSHTQFTYPISYIQLVWQLSWIALWFQDFPPFPSSEIIIHYIEGKGQSYNF